MNPEVDEYGSKWWYFNGKPHRTDGPAIEWINGDKEWFINGKRHRLDGPAIEHSDGYKEWWVNGKRHREDGPAIKWTDGSKAWLFNGRRLFKEDFTSLDQVIKMGAFELFTPQEIVRMRNEA